MIDFGDIGRFRTVNEEFLRQPSFRQIDKFLTALLFQIVELDCFFLSALMIMTVGVKGLLFRAVTCFR